MCAACYSGPGRDHFAVITPPIPAERLGRLRDDVARVTQLIAQDLEGTDPASARTVARAPTEVRGVTRRVALVSPYALSAFGGVQEQILAMSRELSRRGVEVLVVAPDDTDATIYDTPARVVRFGKRLSLPANGSRAPLTLSLRASRSAHAAVRAFAPDVVHFHEPFAPLVGWSTLRAHDAPSVATFHRNGTGPALTLTSPLLRLLSHDLDVASVVSVRGPTIHRATGIEATVLFSTALRPTGSSPRRGSGQVTSYWSTSVASRSARA